MKQLKTSGLERPRNRQLSTIPLWCLALAPSTAVSIGLFLASPLTAQIPNVEWKDTPVLAPKIAPAIGEKVTNGPFKPTWDSLETYETPAWFRDAKFGIFMHWSVNSLVPGGNDGWYGRQMYMQKGSPWGNAYAHHNKTFGHPSVFGYKDLIPLWKAERFDPVELVALYKKAGARYIVPVAVHHDNFDTYASTYQPWNSVNMGPKRDIIGEWEKATRAAGLRFGASSHSDRARGWFDFARKSDTEGPLAGVPYDGLLTKADGKGKWWEGYDPVDLYGPALLDGEKSAQGKADLERYNTAWLNRTLELVNKYQLDLLYFDSNMPMGELGLQVTASLYNNRIRDGKTDGVLNIKWNPRRRAVVEDLEKGLSNFIRPLPWQLDASINNMWFADELPLELTAAQIVHTITDCSSKNGNLLLNVALRADGSADPEERRRLLEVGAWLDINGEAIYATRPTHLWGEGPTPVKNWLAVDKKLPAFTSSDIRYTARYSSLYAIVMRLPDEVAHLQALRTDAGIFYGEITRVEILGCAEPVRWTRDALGLHVTLPATVKARPNADLGIALKITGLTELARDGVVRPLSDGTVQLPCWDAKITGERLAPMDFEPALSNWDRDYEYATWDFVCPDPGRYEIQAYYTADKGDSAAQVHTPWGVFDWKIAKTKDDKTFKLATIATVNVTQAGRHSLSVKPVSGQWKQINLSYVQLKNPLITALPSGRLELPSTTATLNGTGFFLQSQGGSTNVGGWQNRAEWLAWNEVQFTQAGRYRVKLKAAAADGDTSFALTAGPNHLEAKVARTVSWDRLETIELGELTINAPGILRVELRPDSKGWSPLNLASLSFEPITRKSN